MNDVFEKMWSENKNHIYRALLSLTHDVDLADDCLQDTYLNARQGFSSYRGEGERAWLTAIAKNVFYQHSRRKSYGSEESLEAADERPDASLAIGSDGYLDLLLVRDAISQLNPILQKALIMKHYGGCDYQEIAHYLSCTPVTAKHRVWRAIQRLRSSLNNEEPYEQICPQLRGPKILDWLYGVLQPQESAGIDAHISVCPTCKRSLLEMKRLAGILDQAEENYRILTLIDLDERGCTTRYVWVKHINRKNTLKEYFGWHLREGWTLEYLAIQGEPVEIEFPELPNPPIPEEPGTRLFRGKLPNPVPPGQMTDAMFIVRTPEGSVDWGARPLGNGVWHYHHKHTPYPKYNALFVVTIRLPKGARLLEADPKPQKTTVRNGLTSMTWRVITEIVDSARPITAWQFEADLEYVLGL